MESAINVKTETIEEEKFIEILLIIGGSVVGRLSEQSFSGLEAADGNRRVRGGR